MNQLHELLRLIRNQELSIDIKRRSFSGERRSIYIDEHAAIVQALIRRDAEAASTAMHAHLDTVARNLFNGAEGHERFRRPSPPESKSGHADVSYDPIMPKSAS
jgi:DNA-binding GntR family transcriptional regulator